ncbi:branched-chain amino acid ABC transporter, periplasmic substrate-binding protein [Rhodobacterales bacterium HTCC2654]|uniref:Branched-chain amino acid ABC transporter, periplasmic substrate-binding protein n=1 Tax=Maritimibacter alkaliphilus HTCC2654 TaxID=314271 RepID=A3VB37_9RHOB|nr:branched-chain amino acid ABC transporter, periplasmic substrate-binding protein [Rhodobacterales bacterium HTCC2654] [Maritimibacter alkaliphilus HTCC2654]
MKFMKSVLAGGAATLALSTAAMAQDCPIKVGVLHSLSGTMAISETTLKDTMLMLVEKQNEAGGLLGCDLEAVVVDPASDWPLFAEKARELLTVHEVDVIFGNWTSVSRKSVLPVIEELNGLLFYPVQYEAKNRPRTCSTPARPRTSRRSRRPTISLTNWASRNSRCSAPTMSIRAPRNNILESYLKDKGIAGRGYLRQLHPLRPF